MMTTSPRVGQAFGAPRAEDDYISFKVIVPPPKWTVAVPWIASLPHAAQHSTEGVHEQKCCNHDARRR